MKRRVPSAGVPLVEVFAAVSLLTLAATAWLTVKTDGRPWDYLSGQGDGADAAGRPQRDAPGEPGAVEDILRRSAVDLPAPEKVAPPPPTMPPPVEGVSPRDTGDEAAPRALSGMRSTVDG